MQINKQIVYKISFLRYCLIKSKNNEERRLLQTEIEKQLHLLHENNRELPLYTKDELKMYDGKDGKKAYVLINGIIYDVTHVPSWKNNIHYGLKPGYDLSKEFNQCHQSEKILDKLIKVGMIKNE